MTIQTQTQSKNTDVDTAADAAARRRQLARQAIRFWRSLEHLATGAGQEEQLARLITRLLPQSPQSRREDGRDGRDDELPECVLFLRAAVHAGAVAGDVPDAQHDALERFAIALGAYWEETQRTLTPAGERGTRALLQQQQQPFVAIARDALDALEALADDDTTSVLRQLLESRPRETITTIERTCASYVPHGSPWPTTTTTKAATPKHAFAAAWSSPLESTLASFIKADDGALGSAARYLQAQGGKRLRPMVTLAAAAACGSDPAKALATASAIEWLHQTSLVLDDLVDAAATRRGFATLHRARNPLFALGVSAFLLGRLHETLRELDDERVRTEIRKAAFRLAKGECLELAEDPDEEHSQSPARSTTAYYRIVEAKTARLFEAAALTGALACHARPSHATALARYGREIGIAFQIVDDVLDYTGDEATLGKKPGTDLRNGRVTLPLLLLHEAAASTPAERERLRFIEHAGRDPENADAVFVWVKREMDRHGIGEACLDRARAHVAAALEAISELPGDEGRAELGDIARTILERRS